MTDSTLHFLTNFTSTAVLGLISPSHGVVFSIGLSFGKEYGDWANYGKDMGVHEFLPLTTHDMFFNCLGIGVGFLVSVLIRKMLGW